MLIAANYDFHRITIKANHKIIVSIHKLLQESFT